MLSTVLALAASLIAAGPSGPSLPTGRWITTDRSAVLQFSNCAGRSCATLVWAREGLAGRDERNDDRRLRQRPLCNLPIIGALSSNGGGKWAGGWLYDPESGVTFGLRLIEERTALKLFLTDERGRVVATETLRPAPKHEACAGVR